MEKIRNFNTEDEYNNVKDTLLYPTVSAVKQNMKMWYAEKPRILTYTTTKPSQQVKLVDRKQYLDYAKIVETGEKLPVTGTGALNYTFTDDGEHEVELKFKDDATTLQSAFADCSWLTSIPENLFSNCTAVTSFYGTFRDCRGLTSIPENLFQYNTAVTDFTGTFSSCSGLTSIPENLFSNCIKATNFSTTFYGCSGLTSIPENLFKNCTSVNNFSNTFGGCSGLTGSIPANLFTYNTAVTNFHQTFYRCSGLTSIPENLFSNCTAVTTFTYTFNECSGLTGNVPVDNDGTPIYKRSGEGKPGYTIVTGYENCFTNCTGLTDYNLIPSDWGGGYKTPVVTYTTTGTSQQVKLVDKQEYLESCKIVETGEELPVNGTGELNYTFTGRGEHQVELKFKDDATTLEEAFADCSWLTSIPENLFSNCTKVTNFNYTFFFCTELTSIPENLFKYNTAVTEFQNTFNYCSGLIDIPENLFKYNTNVTTFGSTFDYCDGLTSIPENLFSNNTKVTAFNDAFNGCDGLTSIPENLFKYNTAVTSFSNTFDGCSGLTGTVPIDSDGTPIYNRSTPGKTGYSVVPNYNECFRECTGLTDYSLIPSGWK